MTQLYSVRCSCNKLLCRAKGQVEIKCNRCKKIMYFMVEDNAIVKSNEVVKNNVVIEIVKNTEVVKNNEVIGNEDCKTNAEEQKLA